MIVAHFPLQCPLDVLLVLKMVRGIAGVGYIRQGVILGQSIHGQVAGSGAADRVPTVPGRLRGTYQLLNDKGQAGPRTFRRNKISSSICTC